jgi:hypothetical protein
VTAKRGSIVEFFMVVSAGCRIPYVLTDQSPKSCKNVFYPGLPAPRGFVMNQI